MCESVCLCFSIQDYWIALFRDDLCKATSQEIKFLKSIYIVETQNTLSKRRHGLTVRKILPWKNTQIGLPEGNQAIRTPSPVQGLTRDPGELTPVMAWRQTAPPSLTAGGAGGTPPGFAVRGTELEDKKALVSPDEGEWRSKCYTGQLFLPITCYPTHRKRLAQRGDCRISQRCSCRPAPSSTDSLL